MTYYSAMHLVRRINSSLADGIIFQIIPNPLVGIQLWRIRRQKEQTKALLHRFRFNESGDQLSLMRRMTVNNQKDHLLRPLKQPLDKFKKLSCSNSSFYGHESEFTLSTDRRYNIETETSAGSAYYRRFTFFCPRGAGMVVRAHPCFISK